MSHQKTRTITLTDRRPVRIVEDEWPIVAKGSGDSWHGNDYGRHQQALGQGELDRYWLVARRHADGRTLVYAVFDAATAWTGSEDYRGGALIGPNDDLSLCLRLEGERAGLPDSVIREAIASMEPEDL